MDGWIFLRRYLLRQAPARDLEREMAKMKYKSLLDEEGAVGVTDKHNAE